MRSSGLVLFTCAGLLLSGGAILGGSTAWSLLRISYYFWTTDLGVELGSSVLFVVGALLCLPACWLCTIVPYHPKGLTLMATLMTLVTVAMLMLSLGLSSVAGLSRAVREPAALNSSMLRAMSRDAHDPAVKSSFAAMQMELRCCGVVSYTDWYQHRRALPPSCCGRVWNGKRGDQCNVPLHVTGCLRPALIELRSYVNALSALASAIIMVLGVTLFTTAYAVVCSVVEREPRHKPQPLRIACLTPGACLAAAPAAAHVFAPPM
ncbi:CD63 antigen-like [Ostrinia nubilalis]|uniref:CD63 antigen-like n=1 Tax=Ostrinia furnacalis TaxID=93504 RepID=UPI00103F64BE|nr:CD63 antigen-like [Ostrinia furnacalis]